MGNLFLWCFQCEAWTRRGISSIFGCRRQSLMISFRESSDIFPTLAKTGPCQGAAGRLFFVRCWRVSPPVQCATIGYAHWPINIYTLVTWKHDFWFISYHVTQSLPNLVYVKLINSYPYKMFIQQLLPWQMNELFKCRPIAKGFKL